MSSRSEQRIARDGQDASYTTPDAGVAALADGDCVLFVSATASAASGGVWRAQALADLLQLPLLILHVLSERRNRLLNALDATSAGRLLSRFVQVARISTEHYRGILGDRFADDRLVIGMGDVVEEAAVYATELAAAVVVVAADELNGTQVTHLARIAARPVLVTHARRSASGSVVAATDLSAEHYPVLQQARALATLRNAPLVTVHNVPPTAIMRGLAFLRTGRLTSKRPIASALELQRASEVVGADAAVLLQTTDPARAVLDEARSRAADIIVVGTHQRTGLRERAHKSIAATIVDRARRSIIVEPIGR